MIPLFEDLGLNLSVIDPKTKRPKKSTDIKVIGPQASKSPLISIFMEYKKAAILVDTFGEKFLDLINPKKVLFIITTDGYENSSIEYSKNMIKKLIENHNNWEFIFLGADIDSYTEACSIGIKKNRIAQKVRQQRKSC